ncbi:MAG: nucleotidyltransferase family protein [Bacteroidetes bacterium]|nr:nucleotidyltransferase family protein [Bacteroidota bacterium]
MERIAVIVLAGGNSRRMNYPKPWLIFENNATFLETIINRYKCLGFKKIVISLNKAFFLTDYTDRIEFLELHATIIQNNYPEKGRLYSLYIALKELKEVDFVFIHNVDNPFVDVEVVNTLYKERNSVGSTIPSYQGQAGHPIIIGKIVIDEIINNYEKYETLKEVINQFDKKYVEVNSSNILININTPQDYNKVMNEFV